MSELPAGWSEEVGTKGDGFVCVLYQSKGGRIVSSPNDADHPNGLPTTADARQAALKLIG